MAYSILRYYYFLADDRDLADTFKARLSAVEFNMDSKWSFMAEAEDKFLGSLDYRNMLILVLGYCNPYKSWEESSAQLEEWENNAGLKRNDLLGQVSIYASSHDNWDEAVGKVRKVFPSAEPVVFETARGQLTRLNWKWPQGSAHYLFNYEKSDPAMERFFTAILPVIEASLIRLNMISNMYRDRNKTILDEKNKCDKRLAQVLHSQLVSKSAGEKEIEDMEEQVNGLSSSYAILVGDYSLVTDSRNTLNELLDEVVRQLKSNRFLVPGAELIDTMLNPYRSHLSSLNSMENDLRSSWENHQAAIAVVRSRIDIMISRENIETQAQIRNLMETNTSIQEQSLTFQVAAGIIEFIVLAYYSHSLWKALAHNAYALVSPWAQFIAVVLFSAITVETTHLFAEYKQGHKHVKGKLLLFSLTLLVLLVIVIAVSAVLESQVAAH